MPVVWKPQLATGNDLIDLDHKYLIALFNSVELSLSRPENLKYLPVFFRQLVDYTREHFDREEKIQIKIKYPFYAEHKLEHQHIVKNLEQVYSNIQHIMGEGKASPEQIHEKLDAEIISLAREWVIDHLVKTDARMAQFLRDHPHDLR